MRKWSVTTGSTIARSLTTPKSGRAATCSSAPGEIDLVKPYEIHTEITVGERTVAVIIRSQKGGEFNQGRYVPEENRYYESLGPRQTPCEMLPKY